MEPISNRLGANLFLRPFRFCMQHRAKESRRVNVFVLLRSRLASFPVFVLVLAFCSGLTPLAPAQIPGQQQSVESKLPPVRCKIAPTKDAVQWGGTPSTPAAPTTEMNKPPAPQADRSSAPQGDRSSAVQGETSTKAAPAAERDKLAKNAEPQTPNRRSNPPVQKFVSPAAKPELGASNGDPIGTPKAEGQFSGTDGFGFPALLPVLSFHVTPAPLAPAQIAGEQPPNEPKLPPVRSKIAPTKDAVRWGATPKKAPATEVNQSPGSQRDIASQGDIASQRDRSAKKIEAQIPKPPAQPLVLKVGGPEAGPEVFTHSGRDIGKPNVVHQLIRPVPGGSQSSTDTWFQIPVVEGEQTGVEEAVVNPPAGGGNSVGPQPLAQVLADLARRAQRNFVDPGIPVTETIAYNFTDSNLDPWEAFSRLAQIRGYRIVSRENIVTLARNEQSTVSQASPHTVKAEVWLWLDQLGKPIGHPSLALQLAGATVAPNRKPQTVRSLEPRSVTRISLVDTHSQLGDSTLSLTVNPVPLPDGRIQADLGIENGAPSSDGHRGITIRRVINRTVELIPGKQVIEIEGILMPNYGPVVDKQSWVQRWFGKKAPETASARMIVKLTVPDSETPVNTDPAPSSDFGKRAIANSPSQEQRTPEFVIIRNPKH